MRTVLALCVLEDNVGKKEREFLIPSLRRGYGGGPRPGGAGGFLESSVNFDRDGTAMAAIDSYADKRARDFLLIYAMNPFEDKYGNALWISAWALRFLGCYEPKSLKAKVEAAYHAAAPQGAGKARTLPPRNIVYEGNRVACLRWCLAELDFAERLEPSVRTRYQRMLRLLMYTLVLQNKQGNSGDT